MLDIYNANTEKKQLSNLTELKNVLNNVNNILTKQIIPGGDLNFYLDLLLEVKGRNPFLKKPVATMTEIKEAFGFCDIWILRNGKSVKFTFRQNHVKDYIQRRLDFFFISNILQKCITKTDILSLFPASISR